MKVDMRCTVILYLKENDHRYNGCGFCEGFGINEVSKFFSFWFACFVLCGFLNVFFSFSKFLLLLQVKILKLNVHTRINIFTLLFVVKDCSSYILLLLSGGSDIWFLKLWHVYHAFLLCSLGMFILGIQPLCIKKAQQPMESSTAKEPMPSPTAPAELADSTNTSIRWGSHLESGSLQAPVE